MTIYKARYSQPCTNCGLCCNCALCNAAELLFSNAPCPLIRMDGEKTLCGLVIAERAAGQDRLAKSLGVGCGCSMADASTTDEQIDEHNRKSLAKVLGVSD